MADVVVSGVSGKTYTRADGLSIYKSSSGIFILVEGRAGKAQQHRLWVHCLPIHTAAPQLPSHQGLTHHRRGEVTQGQIQHRQQTTQSYNPHKYNSFTISMSIFRLGMKNISSAIQDKSVITQKESNPESTHPYTLYTLQFTYLNSSKFGIVVALMPTEDR